MLKIIESRMWRIPPDRPEYVRQVSGIDHGGYPYQILAVICGDYAVHFGMRWDLNIYVSAGLLWHDDFRRGIADHKTFEALKHAALILARRRTNYDTFEALIKEYGFEMRRMNTIHLVDPQKVPWCMPRFICYGQ